MVTGGAGFIGANFIHYVFNKPDFSGRVINVDNLTYAGNLENLEPIYNKYCNNRYFFERANICDRDRISDIFKRYEIDTVVHFAAESHVDRSIMGPQEFINTNILGTFVLLECARELWKNRDDVLFHHISTDEVFGTLGDNGYFYENTPYNPRSPYSASKASSDHIVRAYNHTYNLPVTVSNCSNNYGPYQFPEKLIPLMILNMLQKKPLPVYGDGKNIRDWVFVEDHNSAVWLILNHGIAGEVYNIGGEEEWENIKLVYTLCKKMAEITGNDVGEYTKLITYVQDRPGHDQRYAINCDKIKKLLSWKRLVTFSEGLDKTIRWYINNEDWVQRVLNGEYRSWVAQNYGYRVK